MDIRFATEGDIPGLLALLLQVGQVHHDIRPDIFPENTLKYQENDLKELLKDPLRPVFVAMEGDLVAGYCFCIFQEVRGDSVLCDRKTLYIDDLCLDENVRGSGIAKALYEKACQFARESGCQAVTLNVWRGNDRAMAFYEKMGMKPQKIGMETIL